MVTFGATLGALSVAALGVFGATSCATKKPRALSAAVAPPPAIPAEDPALVTARALFPGVFGLPEGKRALGRGLGTIVYVPITQLYPDVPAVECLNLLGQPALRGGFASVAAGAPAGAGEQLFTVVGPLVFRDRRAGYVLAIPSGAHGSVALAETSEEGDLNAEPDEPHLDLEHGVSFDRVVVIEPDGRYFQGPASVSFGADGLARVCPSENKRAAEQCEADDAPSAPQVPDPLPYLYDITRCGPGCESLCPSGLAHLQDCRAPPPARCEGKELRLFFPGDDIGGRCQYETWTLRCAESCEARRCDSKSPALVASFSSRGDDVAFAPTASGGAAVLSGDVLVTYAAGARELARVKLETAYDLAPLATPDGGIILANRAGRVRKIGGTSAWQLELDAKQADASAAFHAGTWYGSYGSKLFAIDAASGQLQTTLALPSSGTSGPIFLAHDTMLFALGNELLTYEPNAPTPTRLALPAALAGTPVVDSNGELIVATVDGNVSVVAAGSAKMVANLGKVARATLVPSADGSVLVVTSEKVLEAGATLRKIELGSGRTLFTLNLADFPSTPPIVDARGGIVVVAGGVVTALTAAGARRWALDSQGQGLWARALLAPAGLLYLSSYERLSVFSLAAAAPP